MTAIFFMELIYGKSSLGWICSEGNKRVTQSNMNGLDVF